MSVKLPLLPHALGHSSAARTDASASVEGGMRDALLAACRARPRAVRPWLSVIGHPDDNGYLQVAQALSCALGEQPRVGLLSVRAPAAVERALAATGSRVQRVAAACDPEALQALLARLPHGVLALALEATLAAQLCGLLEVWVGPVPGASAPPHLRALYAAADLRLPSHALGVGRALGHGLLPRLAAGTHS